VPRVPRLRELRELAALSQEELARAAGVSRTTVARAELGLIAPHPSTVRKLARALRRRPADLMVPPAPQPAASPAPPP
jgi:transcriptional regulator with XRE-family HTH domain